MKHYLLIQATAIAALLSSCITAEKCNARFPVEREIQTWYKDTTVITHSTCFDTVVQFKRLDTLIIHDHQTDIRTELVWMKGDSVFVETTCPPDTVRVEKVLQVIKEQSIQEVDATKKAIRWIAILCFSIFLALVSVAYLIRTLKK
jgi:hypothetical protein